MKRPHPQRHRTLSPRTATTTPSTNTNCTLYLSPSPLSLQPVFTPLLLTWNPLCLSPNPDKIDLYLETLNTTTGVLTPVHEWTGVDFSSGMLATEFDPNWWGEGTGAGEVEAGLLMTGVGDPVWMSLGTPGPTFTITYNGSYPISLPSTGAYTGPSVESAPSSISTFSSKHLLAAVLVPLFVVMALVGGYVTWNKLRKRPEKKRWSAVIDKRMSQISQGTYPVPLGSRASSQYSRPSFSPPDARPGSHYSSSGRPSFSPNDRPNSQYSHHSSPLGLGVSHGYSKSLSSSVGGGVGRISFAEERERERPTSLFAPPTTGFNSSPVKKHGTHSSLSALPSYGAGKEVLFGVGHGRKKSMLSTSEIDPFSSPPPLPSSPSLSILKSSSPSSLSISTNSEELLEEKVKEEGGQQLSPDELLKRYAEVGFGRVCSQLGENESEGGGGKWWKGFGGWRGKEEKEVVEKK